jgi:hypothetical protein
MAIKINAITATRYETGQIRIAVAWTDQHGHAQVTEADAVSDRLRPLLRHADFERGVPIRWTRSFGPPPRPPRPPRVR